MLVFPVALHADVDASRAILLEIVAADKTDFHNKVAQAAKIDAQNQLILNETNAFERKRDSNAKDRVTILKAIGASIPNKKGRFTRAENPDLNWLEELQKQPASPAVEDLILDVLTIRGLTRSKTDSAIEQVFRFGFSAQGSIARDECGRYLRRASPQSIPTLTKTAHEPKNSTQRRYARYQLERVGAGLPENAFAQTKDDQQLSLRLLNAIAVHRNRRAVYVLMDLISHPDPVLRKEARRVLLSYVSGPKPPPAPKRRLRIPGGKFSPKKLPLWFDAREMATIEIEKKLAQIVGDTQGQKQSQRQDKTITDTTEALFAAIDTRRQQAALSRLQNTLQTNSKPTKETMSVVDSALFELGQTLNPTQAATAARFYASYGEELASNKDWRAAGNAYAKALALSGPGSEDSSGNKRQWQKAYQTALTKGLGKNPTNHVDSGVIAADAQSQNTRSTNNRSVPWMLYAGIALGLLSFVVLGIGVIRRAKKTT